VKTELCQFCLRSGILCPKCRKKVEKGEVTQLDLEIGRLLLSMEDEYPPLQDVYFHKSVESDGVLAIFVGRGDIPRILSYGGKIIKALEQKTKKTIRPDGTTETRVILKGKGKKKYMEYIDALKDIARESRGMILRVEFAA